MMKTTINEVTTQGIILKQTPYKENDMILHVYTQDYGKIGILARGVRKMTSKNARATQPMMQSELMIHLKKGLSSLVKASPIDYFRHIVEHMDSEIVANYILEYYYRYIEDNDPLEKEYDILYQSLYTLNQGYSPLLVYLLFNVFVLDHNGVSIDVDGCVICGSSQVVGISLLDGGFVCEKHHRDILHSVDVLKAFRHIHKVSFEHIDKLHIKEDVLKQLVTIMDQFVEEYTGVQLKTSTFIKQIV